MEIPNSILYFPSNDSLDHKSPISCLRTDLTYFFFIDLEIRWRFQIRYCTLPQMIHWTTNSISCLWTDLTNFFPLTWKFDGDSKSDMVLSPNDCLDHKSPIWIFWTSFLWMLSFLFTCTDMEACSELLLPGSNLGIKSWKKNYQLTVTST